MKIAAVILIVLAGTSGVPALIKGKVWHRRAAWWTAGAGLLVAAAAGVLAAWPNGGGAAPAWLTGPAVVLGAAGLGASVTPAILGLTQLQTMGGEPLPEAGEDAAADPVADPGIDLLRGGSLIGVFERVCCAVTLMAGWPEGLAVVLAVKGLGRFPELRSKVGVAERFILGTLVSVLCAVACVGVGVLAQS